jgi:hypothetical protein
VQRDAWYRNLSTPLEYPVTIDPVQYSPVRAEMVSEAEKDLVDVPRVQISPGIAGDLASRKIDIPGDATVQLVRGLGRDGATFTLKQTDFTLTVESSGGDPDSPVTHRPLVAAFRTTPLDIYVTAE